MKMKQKLTKCCMSAIITSNLVGNYDFDTNVSSSKKLLTVKLIMMQNKNNKLRRDNKKVKLKFILKLQLIMKND